MTKTAFEKLEEIEWSYVEEATDVEYALYQAVLELNEHIKDLEKEIKELKEESKETNETI